MSEYKQRPFILTVICVLLLLVGIGTLLAGAAIVAMESTIKDAIIEAGIEDISEFLMDMLSVVGFISIAMGILMLVAFYMLWKGIALGWYLALILLIINAVLGILALPLGVLNLIITVLLIIYFLRPNVREFFGT